MEERVHLKFSLKFTNFNLLTSAFETVVFKGSRALKFYPSINMTTDIKSRITSCGRSVKFSLSDII